MINFKHEKYKSNSNSMRYLLTNSFKELPSITLEKTILKKANIKNKIESYEDMSSRLFYEVSVNGKIGHVSVFISEDHLITATLAYAGSIDIKTRDIQELVDLINKILV